MYETVENVAIGFSFLMVPKYFVCDANSFLENFFANLFEFRFLLEVHSSPRSVIRLNNS